MMSSGSPMRQRPMASICCSPPESVPAAWPQPLRELGKHRQDALAVGRPVLPRAGQHRAHVEVFGDGERGENLPAFGHLADAEIADAVARAAGDIDSAERRCARMPGGASRRWCGSARSCRRRWRPRSRRSRLRRPRAKPRRAPARRRRKRSSFSTCSITAPRRRDRIGSPPARAAPGRACLPQSPRHGAAPVCSRPAR